MKKINKIGLLSLIMSLIMVISVVGVNAASNLLEEVKPGVYVRIVGVDSTHTDPVILEETKIPYTSGMTAMDALKNACDANQIPYTSSGTYVSSVAGLSGGLPTYYTGWMFRVWESIDYPNSPTQDLMPYDDSNNQYYGSSEYELSADDRVTWYYMDPRGAYYSTISNYGSIDSNYKPGDSITVNVDGEYMTDGWNFTMSGYNDLYGATVNLLDSDGTVIDNATTDLCGNATINIPSNALGTYYLQVASKVYTSGTYNDLFKHVPSWKKVITVQNN